MTTPRTTRLASVGVAVCMIHAMFAATATAQSKGDGYRERVLPLLEKYCVDCHSKESPAGGIALDRFESQEAAVKSGQTWLRVLDVLEGRTMPPPDESQPKPEDYETLIGWIEKDFLAAQCGQGTSSAAVAIHRLNRREYNNTIRDLLGLNLNLADDFPADDIGFGFDNVGSALNISPVHVEKYLDAAELAMDQAIVTPDAEPYPPMELIGLKTYPLPPDKPVEFEHALKPGKYLANFSLVRVGISEKEPAPRLVIGFGRDRRTVSAVSVQDETVVYRYWLQVAEGDHTVRVALAPNPAAKKDAKKPAEVSDNVSGDQRYGNERGLHVDSMVVRGPVVQAVERLPESHKSILFCEPGFGDDSRLENARRVIARFAERAFRRPVSDEEVRRIERMFLLADERGESFERAIQVALTTVLASPQFLFLVEPDETRADRPLTEFELASRLSYFLWSSMPDAELARTAREGTLRANLRAQVTRMLGDDKSSEFVRNFAGQWLQLRKLATVARDSDLFPGFNDSLKGAMRRETEEFLADVLRENRSILDLLDSDYTFVNESLARHYGMEGVTGEEFRKVKLPDHRRGGVLTQASVLTLTSNPNRTSPVKRGQWILQQILGTPPPPPPADVAKLDESRQAGEVMPLRERMEAHRANVECASCHKEMDPLGFALENYDAIGRWRASDAGNPIDASGELAGGIKFSDGQELKQRLRSMAAKKFSRCLVENMLTYALGRGLEPYDYCAVEEIRSALADDGYRIRNIVFGIVESRAFQNRGAAR